MMNIPTSSIKDVSLFQLSGPECTEKLKNALKSLNYASSVDIVKFNDPADKMFIVVSGTVGFFDSSCNKIGEGKDGSCFGELALVYDIPRTATVRALTDCVVLVLEKEDFETLRNTNPQINDAIHDIAKERFLTFQKTLFQLANTPESMHFTEIQTNLLTEIYYIFRNPTTKNLDKEALESMLKKISGKDFSPEEVSSVFRTLGGEIDGFVSRTSFLLKVRNLGWLVDPNMIRKFKSESRGTIHFHRKEEVPLSEPNTALISFSLGIVFGVVLTLGITRLSSNK